MFAGVDFPTRYRVVHLKYDAEANDFEEIATCFEFDSPQVARRVADRFTAGAEHLDSTINDAFTVEAV